MLFPIIVPRYYDEGGRWIGPMKHLSHPELAVTWVVLNDGGTMTYVNHEAAARYLADGVDYEAEAMRNLRASADDLLYTHERTDDEGDVVFVATMQDDGLGSSRLLLLPEWRAVFSDGFEFGLPERSCAFVVPAGLSPVQKVDTLTLINGCFEKGTTPMLAGLHAASLFEFEDLAGANAASAQT